MTLYWQSVAKLATYGFDNMALALITDCLTNSDLQTFISAQRVKIGATFSSYLEILWNVPILGPILFNLFMNDFMFFIKKTEVYNFADDTTIYSCSLNYKEAQQKLSDDTHIVPK